MNSKRHHFAYSDKLFYFFLFLCVVLISCREKDARTTDLMQISLDTRYQKIDTIQTLAHCTGPNGSYTTEIISHRNGYLQFVQTFEYRDTPFRAMLYPDHTGYVLDENGKVTDTLSAISIEMIRSHDFHRWQTDPSSQIHNLEFVQSVDQDMQLFEGKDRLQHPVSMYYDPAIRQIRRIELQNMMDTTELIQVAFLNWKDTAYGPMADTIQIVQAGKDTFMFCFSKIAINE